MRKMISKHEVKKLLDISTTALWRLEQEPDFPKRIKISAKVGGYFEDEFEAYLVSKQAGKENAA